MTPGTWPDEANPGTPLNPEVGGWHWLQRKSHAPMAALWEPASDDSPAEWIGHPGEIGFMPVDRAADEWSYLGPCLPPVDVAAAARLHEAAGFAAGVEAGRKHIADKLEKIVHDHIHENWSYDGSTNAWETRNAADEEWVHDREELIEWLRALPMALPAPDRSALDAMIEEAVAKEREACAEIVWCAGPHDSNVDIEAAIRTRAARGGENDHGR